MSSVQFNKTKLQHVKEQTFSVFSIKLLLSIGSLWAYSMLRISAVSAAEAPSVVVHYEYAAKGWTSATHELYVAIMSCNNARVIAALDHGGC